LDPSRKRYGKNLLIAPSALEEHDRAKRADITVVAFGVHPGTNLPLRNIAIEVPPKWQRDCTDLGVMMSHNPCEEVTVVQPPPQIEDSRDDPEPYKINEENKQAVRNIHSLLDELKSVEEHEKRVLEEKALH
jgi:hypothetical protein